MRITESFLQGKRPHAPERCEDGFIVTADYAAVADGSTSKPPKHPGFQPEQPKTSGRIAMETALEAVRQLPPAATMPEAARLLTAAICRNTPPEAHADATLRPACSAAIFSRKRREVWLMGDCQCRFDGQTWTNGKLVDQVLATARGDVIRYLLAAGHPETDLRRNDTGRAMICDALREQACFQNIRDKNNPFRYTVIDGTPIDTTTVPVLPLGQCRKLILASDGYPALFDTLDETEAHLKRLLEEDPLCIGRNAGTKGCMEGHTSFDDRTYLSIEL